MTIQRETPDSPEYFFFGCMTRALKIQVRAPNDAHIALTYHPVEGNPMYEIFIGGWGNSKVAFRKNREKPEVCELATPGILSPNEFRNFWITYYDSTLAFGIGENNVPLLVWNDPVFDSLPFVGIRTAWGSSGSWMIDDNWPGWKQAPTAPPVAVGWVPPAAMDSPYGPGGTPVAMDSPYGPGGTPVWVPYNGGAVPPNAVEGGFDNEKIYVGRAEHNGSVTPGKIVPSHGVCYISWGGQEHAKTQSEILTNCAPNWVPATGETIPGYAVAGGTSETGEVLYVGRAQHNNTTTIGKVQPSHKCIYIPYGGEEIGKDSFDVLVI